MSHHLVLLSELPAFNEENGALQVVIETPKGSANKYDYDPVYGCFALAKVMPLGMTFPYDFGFIPSTVADDGDPLDVLVLMDCPAMPGCRLDARLIGAIKGKQHKKGQDPVRNDRLIAVAVHAHEHIDVHALKDLHSHFVEEIVEFFIEYNKQEGHKFKPLGTCEGAEALKLVKRGLEKNRKRK